MSRRQVIGRWTAALVAGANLRSVELRAAGSPVPGPLRLRLADFSELAVNGGSVQLVFSSIFPPLTINRESTNVFHVLDSVCTHAGCTVGQFVSAQGRMACPCHGSHYDIAGRVIRGPADAALKSFANRVEDAGTRLAIEVPEARLGVSAGFAASTGGNARMKLDLAVTALANYEVFRHEAPGDEGTLTPFSLTPEGPAIQWLLTPNSDGTRTLFVDVAGTRAFFSVSMRLTRIGAQDVSRMPLFGGWASR